MPASPILRPSCSLASDVLLHPVAKHCERKALSRMRVRDRRDLRRRTDDLTVDRDDFVTRAHPGNGSRPARQDLVDPRRTEIDLQTQCRDKISFPVVAAQAQQRQRVLRSDARPVDRYDGVVVPRRFEQTPAQVLP
jgi:hypothetical protein